jgi:hypothetical protein
MRLKTVKPMRDCLLYIELENGRSGMFDVKPYCGSKVFAPLMQQKNFEQVHNGGYYVEWRCGADLSADTIEMRLRDN